MLMDEPESALSPQRQLALLVRMSNLLKTASVQFIVATHSPILMTFPGASILSLDQGKLQDVSLEETSHYHITRGILEEPERYWRHLQSAEEGEDPDVT
ncbi:MAG: AAA family ATPase [Verrucomicrobiota bacterium]|nr:AAA family ATPase [Verrucomicrobiota bacterium]